MHETVYSAACERIPAARDEFVNCARRAIHRNHPEELHEARIAAKRLRYLMECFASALGPTRETALRLLAHIQDRLGSIADETAFLRFYDRLGDALDPSDAKACGVLSLRTAAIRRREGAVSALRRLWNGGAYPPYPDMLAATIAAALEQR